MNGFQIPLLQGSFEKEDAVRILTQMVDVKIRYHEDKIRETDNEEDIKMRETRIRQLQKDLHDIRSHILSTAGRVELKSHIQL